MARYYKKDGKKLPSVTTITGQLDKPALTYWAANCACDYIIQELELLPSVEVVNINNLFPIISNPIVYSYRVGTRFTVTPPTVIWKMIYQYRFV